MAESKLVKLMLATLCHAEARSISSHLRQEILPCGQDDKVYEKLGSYNTLFVMLSFFRICNLVPPSSFRICNPKTFTADFKSAKTNNFRIANPKERIKQEERILQIRKNEPRSE